MTVKKAISAIATAVVAFVLVVFGLKGCIVTTWSPANAPETYSIHGVDDRTIDMVFLNGNQIIMWYTDPAERYTEGVLVQMRGSRAIHYVGRLWRIEGPNVTLGYRICPAGTEPANLEIKCVGAYKNGKGDPVFLGKGESSYGVFLFAKDSVLWHGMRLEKTPTDQHFVQDCLDKLGGPKPVGTPSSTD